MPPPLITNDWFSGKKRPAEFGPVTIEFEEIPHVRGRIVRQTSVKGIVAVGPTKGRPSAPEPISGIRVSEAKSVPSQYRYNPETGDNAYNTGIPDAEKGHIMALELGGPDIAENIVPQWAKWQGSGEWRQVEMKIKAIAEEGYNSKTAPFYLQFHACLGYLKMEHPEWAGLKRLAFPMHFLVVITRLDVNSRTPFGQSTTMYNGTPSRNETDDMMALRQLIAVDRASLGEHWEPYPDWAEEQKAKGKSGGMRDASHFVATGQDPQYTPQYAPPPVTYQLQHPTTYDVKVGGGIDNNFSAHMALPQSMNLGVQPMDLDDH